MCIGRSSPLDGVFIDNLGDCKVIEIRHLSYEMKDKIKTNYKLFATANMHFLLVQSITP